MSAYLEVKDEGNIWSNWRTLKKAKTWINISWLLYVLDFELWLHQMKHHNWTHKDENLILFTPDSEHEHGFDINYSPGFLLPASLSWRWGANNCPGAIIGVVCYKRRRIVAYSATFKALGVTLVCMRNARCRNLHSGRHFFGVTLFVRWPIGQRKLLNKNRTSWTKSDFDGVHKNWKYYWTKTVLNILSFTE